MMKANRRAETPERISNKTDFLPAIRSVPLVILAVLTILRLLLVIPAYRNPERFIEVDSAQYIELAQGMRLMGAYRGETGEAMDLLRPPGYPLFLLVGITLGKGTLTYVPLLQLLLVFFTAALLYWTGLELGSQKAGFAAALIYLINPNAAFWSLVLMAETLAGFFLTLSGWSAVKYWQTKKTGWLLLSGLGLSAGAITRPIILPLAVLIALLLAWLEWRNTRSSNKFLSTLFVVLVGVFAMVLPWQLRNAYLHGQFTLSEVSDSTFQNWIVANTMAKVEGGTREEAVATIASSSDPMIFSLGYILDHLDTFAKEQARGIARTLLGAEYRTWAGKMQGIDISNAGMLSALLDRRSFGEFLRSFLEQLRLPWFWAGLYALGFDFLLYGLCAVAVWKTFRGEGHAATTKLAILLVLVLAYLLFVPLGAGESRFRAPADPLLGLLAGLTFYPYAKPA
jgi:4-amino-4-deoxy-L-arabinose transferase-like glycosyltransferase